MRKKKRKILPQIKILVPFLSVLFIITFGIGILFHPYISLLGFPFDYLLIIIMAFILGDKLFLRILIGKWSPPIQKKITKSGHKKYVKALKASAFLVVMGIFLGILGNYITSGLLFRLFSIFFMFYGVYHIWVCLRLLTKDRKKLLKF